MDHASGNKDSIKNLKIFGSERNQSEIKGRQGDIQWQQLQIIDASRNLETPLCIILEQLNKRDGVISPQSSCRSLHFSLLSTHFTSSITDNLCPNCDIIQFWYTVVVIIRYDSVVAIEEIL
jgi:hypothetical protein